jgi:large conductance mechanosensitive channel
VTPEEPDRDDPLAAASRRRALTGVEAPPIVRDVSRRAVSMWQEFKAFLTKTNALALAVGVVIGAAVGKVVSSMVEGLIMPLVGLAAPEGQWREIAFGPPDKDGIGSFKVGNVMGSLLDFTIVALIVFLVTKALLREKPKAPPPSMKDCPYCRESVPEAATKCRACTSALPA